MLRLFAGRELAERDSRRVGRIAAASEPGETNRRQVMSAEGERFLDRRSYQWLGHEQGADNGVGSSWCWWATNVVEPGDRISGGTSKEPATESVAASGQ